MYEYRALNETLGFPFDGANGGAVTPASLSTVKSVSGVTE